MCYNGHGFVIVIDGSEGDRCKGGTLILSGTSYYTDNHTRIVE